MNVTVREYMSADAMAAMKIWNEVVEEGDAFPQLKGLTEDNADAFFKHQSYTGIAVDADGAVLDVFAGLTTGRFDLGVVNQPQDNVLLLVGDLNGWHVLKALFDLTGGQLGNVAGEQGCRDAFGFFNGLFTVHELGNLACQRLLGLALPWLGLDFFSQCVDFVLAQESEVLQVNSPVFSSQTGSP